MLKLISENLWNEIDNPKTIVIVQIDLNTLISHILDWFLKLKLEMVVTSRI